MHLLQAQDSSPLDADEAIDLGQSPGDVVVLSAADTELSALALASQSLMMMVCAFASRTWAC